MDMQFVHYSGEFEDALAETADTYFMLCALEIRAALPGCFVAK